MTDLRFAAIATQRYGVVIRIYNVLGVDGHGQLRTHRTGRNRIDPNAIFAKLCRILLCHVNDRSFRRAIGHPQG